METPDFLQDNDEDEYECPDCGEREDECVCEINEDEDDEGDE